MSDIPPLPPSSTAVWYDPALTWESVLRQLRLDVTDPDAPTVIDSISAAASLIDQYLDRTVALTGPPPPAPVQQALEQLTIELYRRRDAPFNLLNATVPEDIPVDISAVGAIQSVAALVQPWKQRWGYA